MHWQAHSPFRANVVFPHTPHARHAACLCFPVFLVVCFDTGILYQVAVFLYGCTNGLFVQKLGQARAPL
jgi:hypothetical protein